MTQLSICIPTYNRAKCLTYLLDSILAQDDRRVEVVVYDDASTDDTTAAIQPYMRRINRLKYLRHEKNVGLDRNFLSIVAAAESPYVWLMGDDDRLEPGALSRVIDTLRLHPDAVGATLGVLDYSSDFKQLTGLRRMPDSQVLMGSSSVFQQIPELLGFMSSMIIRRESWDSVVSETELGQFHNLYLQLYIAGRALGSAGKWILLNEPCVGFRSDNDQFLDRMGWLDRTLADVSAYESIGASLFPSDSTTRLKMRKRIFRSHIRARIRNGKLSGLNISTVFLALAKLIPIYKGVASFWLEGLPTLVSPAWVLQVAKWSYQHIGGRSGLARARRMTA